MKISGFTMAKNASKLYYPMKEAIASILPIVDEFVVALGDSDADDDTLRLIESLNSPKIKIIHTTWDLKAYPTGMENAHQTDIAKNACSGDWLFYLQADEVVHEKYLDEIRQKCELYLHDKRVEGLLFKYRHFFGDYDHYNDDRSWYPNEIRIVRNDPDIHSYKSAQSFRRIPNFDGKSYRQKEGTFKLNVAKIDAYIYHYGWVRPPHLMQKKSKALDTIHKGTDRAEELYRDRSNVFNYGPLGRIAKFTETHPAVMKEFTEKFDWADQLNYGTSLDNLNRKKMKHERFKYRALSYLEKHFLGGRRLFGHFNWKVVAP